MISAENELAALAALKKSISDILDDDPEFLFEFAEAQTNIFELIDLMLTEDAADDGLVRGLKSVIDELAARRSRVERRKDRRRVLLEQALLLLETKRLDRPAASLSLVARAGKLDVLDEAALPARFFVSVPALDRGALKSALEAGEAVDGATLTPSSTTLTVRRR